MLKTITRLFKRDRDRERGGLARLGEYSEQNGATDNVSDTRSSGTKKVNAKPTQRISTLDLVEDFSFEGEGGGSEGWPAPHRSARQSARGDADFFEQGTGFAEVFPTTLSQRSAILGKSSLSAPSATLAEQYATSIDFDDEDEDDVEEYGEEEYEESNDELSAPKQSIRVQALPISVQGQEMIDALRKLPGLLEEARQAPEAALETLKRVDGLANSLRSQQSLQREATQDLRSLRLDFQGFLKNITNTVSELTAMHSAALQECSLLSDDNRKALRSQRMHVIEMRRQQQDAYYRLEDEQEQRIRAHELRTNRTMRKFGFACVAMLVLMALCVGVFMRYTSSIIDSTSRSYRDAQLQAPASANDKLNDEIESLIDAKTAERPRG